MRIYFDVSCLNRPFDDQAQPRIHLESESEALALDEIDAGRWEQVSSRMAEIELAAISADVRRRRVQVQVAHPRAQRLLLSQRFS